MQYILVMFPIFAVLTASLGYYIMPRWIGPVKRLEMILYVLCLQLILAIALTTFTEGNHKEAAIWLMSGLPAVYAIYVIYVITRSLRRERASLVFSAEQMMLRLLSYRPEVDGSYSYLLTQLVDKGYASKSEGLYHITDAGCEELAKHVKSSRPKSDSPCGWREI